MPRTENSSLSSPLETIPVVAPKVGGRNSRPSRAGSGPSFAGKSQNDFAYSPDRTFNEDLAYCVAMSNFVLERGFANLADSYLIAVLDITAEQAPHLAKFYRCSKCCEPERKPLQRRREKKP